jgi:hypothetical protein
MSKVDWSTAPEGAEFFAVGFFYKTDDSGCIKFFIESKWNEAFLQSKAAFADQDDYEERPTISAKSKEQPFAIHGSLSDQPITISVKSPEWPDEERIDRIGRDRTSDDLGHYEATELTTAADFLSAGLEILSQRGEQYGNDGRECSFPQAAEAFNALTGHKLKGSDICLIIALVKQVRQYAQPSRFHEDSAVDGVNYLALQSELLKKERV